MKNLSYPKKLSYEFGIKRLKIDDLTVWQDAGTEIEPMGDLNTEAEKKLGRLVKEKYVESTSLV